MLYFTDVLLYFDMRRVQIRHAKIKFKKNDILREKQITHIQKQHNQQQNHPHLELD